MVIFPVRTIKASLRAALLASVFGLAACSAVGPDYQAPAMTIAPFHNDAAVAARPATATAPLDSWWTGFKDPVLTALIQRALAQNLDLAASLARVEQSRAAVMQADAALLPSVDANAQTTWLHQSLESPLGAIGSHLPGYNRDDRLYDLGVGASWEADLFGGLKRADQAAAAEMQAAEANHAGVRISVAAEVGDAYFQIRGYQARIRLTRAQIANDEQLLTLVRQREDKGAAATLETAQAEALLQHGRAALPPLTAALEIQKNRLAVLLGAQPGSLDLALDDSAEIAAPPAITGGETAGDLLRRRPDLIAAERHLAASNAAIGVAVAHYYPSLSLSGLLGFESLSAGDLVKSATFQPQAVAGLRWRLFDFGRVDAEVAQAKGANREALALYRQSVLHAAEDVENSFITLVQTEAQQRETAREVDALTRARDRSREAYTAGAIGLTDLLDADRQLLVAQDENARTRADSSRAAVTAFRALGGGW